MTLDLTTLIDELREHLGVDDTELDDEKATLLLNRSYWSMLDKFPFREKEVTAAFATVDGTNLYAVPSPFEALRSLAIKNNDDDSYAPLARMTQKEYDGKFVDNTDEQGFPEKYYREKNCIKLWPTPDDEYTINIRYWTVLDDLDDLTDVPGVPQNWHEIILYGAIWRGFYRLGDVVRGERFKKLDVTLTNEAVPTESKEERDSPTAGVEVLLNEYDVR